MMPHVKIGQHTVAQIRAAPGPLPVAEQTIGSIGFCINKPLQKNLTHVSKKVRSHTYA